MAVSYAPPERPGRRLIYFPHRIVQGNGNPYAANLTPRQAWHQFPIPQPLGWALPSFLACRPLTKAKVTTRKSVTATPSQVRHMPDANRLLVLRRCRPLWGNLVSYCHPTAAEHPNGPGQQAPGVFHTCVVGQTPLPDGRQQADVIDGLFGWFVGHCRRIPQAMTSEPSVQDEVHTQIIEPLNMLLQGRYPTRNPDGQGFNVPYYPQWGRSCPKAHRTPGVINNAGFPDFLLYNSPTQHDHACVFEVKTWWSCRNRDLRMIFSDAADPFTGRFYWTNLTLTVTLLKQIWGELYFFQTNWGACTNGHMIFIFVKTSQNELTISEIHRFDDQELHAALLGMCCAAIDEGVDGGPWIRNVLCPPAQRESHW